MTEKDYKNFSLAISTIGWLLFILSFIIYLFVMKPFYFEQGVEAGRQQQFLEDVNIVDQYLLIPEQSPEVPQTIIGRVTDIPENSIDFINITGTYNPLLYAGDEFHAVITPDTRIFKRSRIAEAEIEQVRDSVVAGEELSGSPYIDEDISLTEFAIGDRIEVMPTEFGDAGDGDFFADYIILLDMDDVEFGS